MKYYLERFLLPVFASLVVAVVTTMLAGKIDVRAGLVIIGSIAAAAFLAAVVAETLPSRDSHTVLRRANVLIPTVILILLAGYAALHSSMFRGMYQTTPGQGGATGGGTLQPGKSGPERSRLRTPPTGETSNDPEDAFAKKYIAADGQPYRAGEWTVLISAAGSSSFPEVHAAAEAALSEKGYAVRPLFRTTLFQDNAAFSELYAGNPALLQRIGAYRDGVLVCKLRAEISQNTSLDMFTTHLFADVRVIAARTAKVQSQFAIDEAGAGFTESAATAAADRRLAEQLKRKLSQSIPPK